MSRLEKAHVYPFGLFMLLLALREVIDAVWEGEGPLWTAQPQYWIFPVQTVLCAGVVWWFRGMYEFGGFKRIGFTLGVAVLVLAIWISPQEIFGFDRRLVGFNPEVFAGQPVLYAVNLVLRLVRLVIVVPVIEEVFWRGFLMRWLIDHRFERVPFGTFEWRSFGGVALFFGLAHWGPDFIPALITGLLYNLVAWRTRSLACCVVAHAVTNLLLGIYILQTRQWGFW